MSLLAHLSNEIIAVTWRTSLLIALVFTLRPLLVRWLPLKLLPWLWLIVAIKLLLLSAPAASWSLYNLSHLFQITPAQQHLISSPISAGNSASATTLPSTTATGELWTGTLLFVLIWLLGIALLATAQITACLRFHRQLDREKKPIGSRWQQMLDESAIMVGLKTTPALIETSFIGTPAVIGLFRPRLLMPHGLLDRLKPEETRLVFLHELSHLRRHDLWLQAFFALARTIHWFNPLAWLAERSLRIDCEAACDADVLRLNSSLSERYGYTLLRLTQLSSPCNVSVLVAAISTNSNQTKRRLQMIMKYQNPTAALSMAALLIVIALGLLTLPNEATAQEQSAAPSSVQLTSTTTNAGLIQKIKNDRISLDFNKVSLEQAISTLKDESARQDPDHKGINFVISTEVLKSAKPITLNLKDASFGAALDNICQLSDVQMRLENGMIHFVPPTQSTENVVSVQSPRQALEDKLKSIVIDKVNFDKTDIATVLQFLAAKSKELDPEKQGINFVLRLPDATKDSPTTKSPTIHREVTISLENIPLSALLPYIAEQTNLQCSVEDYAVFFKP